MALKQLMLPANRAFDSNGLALPGSVAKLYATGTLTPANFLAADGTTSLGSSITANGAGRFDLAAYNDETTAYRLRIESALGVELDDIDPFFFGSTIWGTITLASGASVATRTALAAISAVANQEARLTEAVREGMFVFSTANLSAKVTADTRQGIYVPPSSDTTGASGAWVRKFNGPLDVAWFGLDGVNDTPAIHACCALALVLGRLNINLSQNMTCTDRVIFDEAGLVINAHGVTLSQNLTSLNPAVRFTGAGTTVYGLTIHLTDTSTNLAYVDVDGPNVHFHNVTYTRDATTNIPFYLRLGADGFEWHGGEMNAYGGINAIDVSHVLIEGVYFHQPDSGATDDSIAIKSITTEVTDWRIANCRYRNKADFVAIGSEVGTSAANDSTYSKGVYGVEVTNCYGERCACILNIKLGLQYDYRDGTVQNVSVTNCHLRDTSGIFARNLAFINACRGARVRDIYITNCTARYRCPDTSGSGNAGILIIGSSITGGTATAEIDGVYVNDVSVIDPFGGAANGTAGTSGYPITQSILFDASTGSGGSVTIVKRVEINNFHGNGCARMACNVTSASAITGPLVLRNPVLLNYTASEAASTDRASIVSASKIQVTGLHAVPSASADATTRGVMGDGAPDKTKEILDPAGQRWIHIGDVAATTTFRTSYIADQDLWLASAWFVNNAAISASGTNKVTIEIINRSTAADVVLKDSNTGFAVAANTPVSINGTTQFTGANAYIPKGTNLTINVTTAGTTTLQGACLQLRTVPYKAMS